MKVQHFSNSFIGIKTDDAHIVCDPWVGIGNHGGWHSAPEFSRADLYDQVRNSSHVYISHIHSDHLDPEFIKQANLVEKTFIIKKFTNGLLKRRLGQLGVEKIIEIEPFTKFNLTSKTSVSIVPQMTSNSADAEDAINFDIDTSLVVNDQKFTFFNQVDNPLAVDDFKVVKKFITENYGEIDLACFACGAASEYPQCFLNLDRETEKKRIVDISLNKLERVVDIIAPKLMFIAGGTYFIPGKFHTLNRLIAQPTFAEVTKKLGTKTRAFQLEGGREIDLSLPNPPAHISRNINPLYESVAGSIAAHKNDLYQHQQFSPVQNNELVKLFEAARINYAKKLQELGIIIDRKIIFKVYENMEIDDAHKLVSQPSLSFQLEPGAESANGDSEIIVHIDNQALYRCLTRKAIWNQTLSGSLCLYERTPNTYEPTVLFSLNFLVAERVKSAELEL